MSKIVMRTNLQDAMKNIIKFRNETYMTISERIGVTLQTVSDRLNKKNAMSVATLLQLCEATECELVIRSTKADRSEWVITDAIKPEKPKS